METLYLIKLPEGYYGGRNEKYPDMYNLTNALHAKRLTEAEVRPLLDYFRQENHGVIVETYDPLRYAKECINRIIQYNQERISGKDPGYAVQNNAKNALAFLEELTKEKP